MLFYATSIDINLKDPQLLFFFFFLSVFSYQRHSQLDVGREMFCLSGYNFYCRTMLL